MRPPGSERRQWWEGLRQRGERGGHPRRLRDRDAGASRLQVCAGARHLGPRRGEAGPRRGVQLIDICDRPRAGRVIFSCEKHDRQQRSAERARCGKGYDDVAGRLFTSESVTEGHPDKIADQISDTVLDALLADDPKSRVAVETLLTTGLVVVAGEVTTETYAEIPRLVRERILSIGYDSSVKGFDGNSCGVQVAIGKQSSDIAQGVDDAYEERADHSTDPMDKQGAGDQGLMFGYACDDTPELMPLPIMIAHRLAERLSAVRKDGTMSYLRPDGMTQVTIEYDDENRPVRVGTVVVSTQHAKDISLEAMLPPDIAKHVVGAVLDEFDIPSDGYRLLVNPTGRFEVGGPMGDAGLTGRKIIIDTYGGMARHGGGAFSGKDPSKVDRSAAYAMRWVAKNVVAAGLARRCEVQVAYAIGKAQPVGFYVDCFGTETVPVSSIQKAVLEVFDLRPAAIIRDLDLLRPIYAQTAAYGHFGRELPDFSWEKTDRVDAIRAAAGVCPPAPRRRPPSRPDQSGTDGGQLVVRQSARVAQVGPHPAVRRVQVLQRGPDGLRAGAGE